MFFCKCYQNLYLSSCLWLVRSLQVSLWIWWRSDQRLMVPVSLQTPYLTNKTWKLLISNLIILSDHFWYHEEIRACVMLRRCCSIMCSCQRSKSEHMHIYRTSIAHLTCSGIRARLNTRMTLMKDTSVVETHDTHCIQPVNSDNNIGFGYSLKSIKKNVIVQRIY